GRWGLGSWWCGSGWGVGHSLKTLHDLRGRRLDERLRLDRVRQELLKQSLGGHVVRHRERRRAWGFGNRLGRRFDELHGQGDELRQAKIPQQPRWS
ncbi:MAG TPA: hypothetical protein VMS64_19785, partial [Candidatus Methylomirabilis sp.]|nr:hypothetical protein [Candidatus Methylomirabilis sp.]